MKVLVTLFGICIALVGILTAFSPTWFKPVMRFIDESRYSYELVDPSVFIGLGIFIGGGIIFLIGLMIAVCEPASDDDPEEEE